MGSVISCLRFRCCCTDVSTGAVFQRLAQKWHRDSLPLIQRWIVSPEHKASSDGWCPAAAATARADAIMSDTGRCGTRRSWSCTKAGNGNRILSEQMVLRLFLHVTHLPLETDDVLKYRTLPDWKLLCICSVFEPVVRWDRF
jgi:hypothetical protein